jgi:hypothetical protein
MEITEMNTIRSFEYNGTKYNLVKPSAKITRQVKKAYTLAWTSAYKEGILLRAELEKELKDRNESFIIEYESNRSSLLSTIAELQEKLASDDAFTPEELETMAAMLSLSRSELLARDQIVNNLLSNTAEQIADDERILNLTQGMIYKENNLPVWATLDELLEEEDYDLVETCKYQVICYEYNLDPEWNTKLPEVIAFEKAGKLKQENKELEDNKAVEVSNQIEAENLAKIDDKAVAEVKVETKKAKKVKGAKTKT